MVLVYGWAKFPAELKGIKTKPDGSISLQAVTGKTDVFLELQVDEAERLGTALLVEVKRRKS